MRRLDQFYYRNSHRGVRNLALCLVAFNVAMFVLDTFFGGTLMAALYYNPVLILERGQWWRVFSFMLLPGDNSMIFFLFQMLFLYWIVSTLERALGRLKLTVYYFSGVALCILFAALHLLLYNFFPDASFLQVTHLLTAYELEVSLMLAFATVNPDAMIRIYFILPVKVKWLALLSFALLLYGVIVPPHSMLSLFPLVGIGNYFMFFAGDFVRAFFVRTKSYGCKINFEKATRDKRRERGYTHKCAVCGATDTDSPGLEFRYCSLCSGYQCYCARHIFNHDHTRG